MFKNILFEVRTFLKDRFDTKKIMVSNTFLFGKNSILLLEKINNKNTFIIIENILNFMINKFDSNKSCC